MHKVCASATAMDNNGTLQNRTRKKSCKKHMRVCVHIIELHDISCEQTLRVWTLFDT